MFEQFKTYVNDHKTTIIKVAAGVIGAAICVAVVAVVIRNAEDLEAEANLLESGEGTVSADIEE